MYLNEIVLILVAVLSAILSTAIAFSGKKIKFSSIIIFGVSAIAVAIHIYKYGFLYIFLPFYVAAFVMLLAFIFKRFKIMVLLFSLISIVLVLAPTYVRFFTPIFYENYSTQSYEKSFLELNNSLNKNYPLKFLKGIDFNEKRKDFQELFKNADKEKSKLLYYEALREYIRSFPDGHFSLNSLDTMLLGYDNSIIRNSINAHIGGSLGFTVTELDDGNSVVGIVQPNSEADKAGIKPDTKIVSIDNKPIKEFASSIPDTWLLMNTPSKEMKARLQYMISTRCAVGSEKEIRFIDNSGNTKSVKLKAFNDNNQLLKSDFYSFFGKTDSHNIEGNIFDRKFGYIAISKMPEDKDNTQYNKAVKLLQNFNRAKVKEIIIDLRNNSGGEDQFGAKLLGLFTNKNSVYTKEYIYDDKLESIVPQKTIKTVAHKICPNVPITVLINNTCVSAGEGFTYNLKKLDNVKTAGISRTNGSFGSITGGIFMPDNLFIIFPNIACCDEKGDIIIDIDKNGKGGISPDIKIPYDENAFKAKYIDKKDYELDYILSNMK